MPTFREAENIPPLVAEVDRVLRAAGLEWELIFADDDSGDGSEELVQELAERLPVRMVRRTLRPRDLSRSVLLGLETARFDRVVVMDADLSHPPVRIPDLLRTLDAGCEMAVGSRYLAAGSVDRSWSFWRVLNSRAATLLARPLVRCADPLSGFFAVRRSSLGDPQALRPTGYKIGLELMVRCRLRVVEVPIDFRDRRRGASKLGSRQQLQFLRQLAALYLHRRGHLVRFLCFAAIGAGGFVIDVGVYYGLQGASVDHRLARFLSFWPAATSNWWLNRRLTFADRKRGRRGWQWTKFVLGSTAGLVVNVGSYLVLTSIPGVFERARLLALLIGVGLGSVVNFLLASRFVYPDER